AGLLSVMVCPGGYLSERNLPRVRLVTTPLANEVFPPRAKPARPVAASTFGILCRGEVSEWLMVPLSKSGVRKHRGFESRPLRHLRAPAERPGVRWPLRSSITHLHVRSLRSSWPPSPERPAGALTLLSTLAERPGVRWPLRSSLTHLQDGPLRPIRARLS